MKKAIFLVTSLAGLRKSRFKTRVNMCLSEKAEVTVLLAMVRFNEFAPAKQQLAKTFKKKALDQVNIVTLADLVATSQGVALTTEEAFDQRFLSATEKVFEDLDNPDNTIYRYVEAGQILGEVVKDKTDTTLAMTRFDVNQPVQTAVFQADQIVGLLNYVNGQLTQSLLLNNSGELVYRFLRHERQVNWLYSFGRTSKLALSNQMVEDDPKEPRIVYNTSDQKPYYEVIDHGAYHRLGDLYAFYALLLQALRQPGTELFIDIDDNQDLVSQMPQQLIFNY